MWQPIRCGIRDVSGAGDTVAAVMAVLLAMKTPFELVMRAGQRGRRRGRRQARHRDGFWSAELRQRILPAFSLAPEDKIVFDWSVLGERLYEWRRLGLRIGFTNGCFDILHRGHIWLWPRRARRAICCGRAEQRPLDPPSQGQGPADQSGRRPRGGARCSQAVDLVVVFEEDTPLELIKRVRPECPCQRRRLQTRRGGRRRVVKPSAARSSGRSGARAQHHENRSAFAQVAGHLKQVSGFPRDSVPSRRRPLQRSECSGFAIFAGSSGLRDGFARP